MTKVLKTKSKTVLASCLHDCYDDMLATCGLADFTVHATMRTLRTIPRYAGFLTTFSFFVKQCRYLGDINKGRISAQLVSERRAVAPEKLSGSWVYGSGSNRLTRGHRSPPWIQLESAGSVRVTEPLTQLLRAFIGRPLRNLTPLSRHRLNPKARTVKLQGDARTWTTKFSKLGQIYSIAGRNRRFGNEGMTVERARERYRVFFGIY